ININKTREKVEKEYIDKKEEAERINAILYDGYRLGFYENKEFIGIFFLNENVVKKLIYLILNDEKKVFSSENLINDFQKTQSLGNFARRLFFILENTQDYLKKVHSLSAFFEVEIGENENERINKCLFSLQTAFAFSLKIISLKGLEKKFSFSDPINLKRISLSSRDELKKFLVDLESEVFEKCENEIRKIIEQISEYENINYKDDDVVATNFFIDLYPDLVIEEAAKNSKSKVSIIKILDPACDLNPIAVLQARINYLLTIRNYYQKEETIEIPLDTQIEEIIGIYLPMGIELSDGFFGKLFRNIRDVKQDAVKNITEIFREDLGINSEEELKCIEKNGLQINRSIFGVPRNIGGNNLNVCALMANVVASRKLNYKTGCLGFIMPKSLLFNSSYEGFRPFILESGERLYLQKYFNFDNVKRPFGEVDLPFGIYFYSSQPVDYQQGIEQIIFYSKKNQQDKGKNLLVSIQKDSNNFSVVDNEEELKFFKLIQGEFAYKFRTGVSVTRKDICRFFYEKKRSSATSYFIRNQKGKKIKMSENLAPSIELENEMMYPYITTSNLSPFKKNEKEIE
ncbi:4766_t:CDS:2, partial [Cetraspora pellucida]